MTSRKSIMHPRVEELGGLSASPTSPFRRRSSIAPSTVSTSFEENDDEAERQIRRREQTTSPQDTTSTDRRRSLGLGFVSQMSNPQIIEKVQHCIQLSTENKINTKNAFSLQMIDFMAYMTKKQDVNMNNLQVASTSLDVSTKIYGLRVDSVHTDVMKMSGGMEKQDKNDARRDETINENGDADESQAETQLRERAKKKKKRKQNIVVSAESLRGPIETINPASAMKIGDTQTTDKLYLATMSYQGNRGLDLHLNSDIVLDVVDPTKEGNLAQITCPIIPNLRQLSTCSSLSNFEMIGWSIDDEPEELSPVETTPINNDFHFDLDASLPADDDNGGGMNFFDIEDNEDVEGCQRVSNPTANIVDFREIVQASIHNQNFEYSYFHDTMDIQWAGPSHWKIRNRPKNLTGSRIVGRCDQEPVKRKKELNLAFNDDAEGIASQFEESRGNATKLQAKTVSGWSEDKLTLPQNMQYIVSKTCEYYLSDKVMNFSKNPDLNGTQVSDEIGNYDYNNEHDTTDYCPNIGCDDQPENADGIVNNEGVIEENAGVCTQAFMGDNLVGMPKMTNEVNIAFAQRAKKIDMRQLKKCIWKNLISAGPLLTSIDEENADGSERPDKEKREKVVGTVAFSSVFEELPKTLSKNNVEALSLPIAFISLLHLANEKNLQIDSNDDQSDLFVKQG